MLYFFLFIILHTSVHVYYNNWCLCFLYKNYLEVLVYWNRSIGTTEVATVSFRRDRLQCTRIYFQTAVSVQIVTVTSFSIPPLFLKNISELYTFFMPLVSFSAIMNQQTWRPESCDKAQIFSRCHISHISTVTDQTPEPTDFHIGFASQ